MSAHHSWADSQYEKLNRVHELLNEIADLHKRMQSLLLEEIIKSQAARGVKDIEDFLNLSEGK